MAQYALIGELVVRGGSPLFAPVHGQEGFIEDFQFVSLEDVLNNGTIR